jgi:hypothetical protein
MGFAPSFTYNGKIIDEVAYCYSGMRVYYKEQWQGQ